MSSSSLLTLSRFSLPRSSREPLASFANNGDARSISATDDWERAHSAGAEARALAGWAERRRTERRSVELTVHEGRAVGLVASSATTMEGSSNFARGSTTYPRVAHTCMTIRDFRNDNAS